MFSATTLCPRPTEPYIIKIFFTPLDLSQNKNFIQNKSNGVHHQGAFPADEVGKSAARDFKKNEHQHIKPAGEKDLEVGEIQSLFKQHGRTVGEIQPDAKTEEIVEENVFFQRGVCHENILLLEKPPPEDAEFFRLVLQTQNLGYQITAPILPGDFADKLREA